MQMEKLDITTMSDYKKVEAVIQLLIDGVLTSYRGDRCQHQQMSILDYWSKVAARLRILLYQTAMFD